MGSPSRELCEKLYKTKLADGASCPAVMTLEAATDLFTSQPIILDGGNFTHFSGTFD